MSAFRHTPIVLLVTVLIVSKAVRGWNDDRNTLPTLNSPFVSRKTKKCYWPGDALLKRFSVPQDKRKMSGWLKNVDPQAFKNWLSCSKQHKISKGVAKHRLRLLRSYFLKHSEAAKMIVKNSGCSLDQLLALFDPKATAQSADKAMACIKDVIEQPMVRISVSTVSKRVVRVDEDCERQKRNMINRAENLLLAAIAAVAAAGICCIIPASALGWCPILATAIAAELVAIAELQSAREFECPKCSNEPMTRMASRDLGTYPATRYLTFTGLDKLQKAQQAKV